MTFQVRRATRRASASSREGEKASIVTKSILDDREILREVERARPDIVAIDAPPKPAQVRIFQAVCPADEE